MGQRRRLWRLWRSSERPLSCDDMERRGWRGAWGRAESWCGRRACRRQGGAAGAGDAADASPPLSPRHSSRVRNGRLILLNAPPDRCDQNYSMRAKVIRLAGLISLVHSLGGCFSALRRFSQRGSILGRGFETRSVLRDPLDLLACGPVNVLLRSDIYLTQLASFGVEDEMDPFDVNKPKPVPIAEGQRFRSVAVSTISCAALALVLAACAVPVDPVAMALRGIDVFGSVRPVSPLTQGTRLIVAAGGNGTHAQQVGDCVREGLSLQMPWASVTLANEHAASGSSPATDGRVPTGPDAEYLIRVTDRSTSDSGWATNTTVREVVGVTHVRVYRIALEASVTDLRRQQEVGVLRATSQGEGASGVALVLAPPLIVPVPLIMPPGGRTGLSICQAFAHVLGRQLTVADR